MTAGEWREFAQCADAKRIRRSCLDGLACAHGALGAVFPNAVFGWLAAPATDELSGAYLLRAGRWFRLALSLRSLATWRERATLLWGLCVPPADYLLAKYRVRNRCLLPWLYARRIVAGVWKFRKS